MWGSCGSGESTTLSVTDECRWPTVMIYHAEPKQRHLFRDMPGVAPDVCLSRNTGSNRRKVKQTRLTRMRHPQCCAWITLNTFGSKIHTSPTRRCGVDIRTSESLIRHTGAAIPPRGDMPKNRVLITRGAACHHTRRSHPTNCLGL
jgi:hypothetical protein